MEIVALLAVLAYLAVNTPAELGARVKTLGWVFVVALAIMRLVVSWPSLRP